MFENEEEVDGARREEADATAFASESSVPATEIAAATRKPKKAKRAPRNLRVTPVAVKGPKKASKKKVAEPKKPSVKKTIDRAAKAVKLTKAGLPRGERVRLKKSGSKKDGAVVRAFRIGLGLGQREFAEKVGGMVQGTVSEIERGTYFSPMLRQRLLKRFPALKLRELKPAESEAVAKRKAAAAKRAKPAAKAAKPAKAAPAPAKAKNLAKAKKK